MKSIIKFLVIVLIAMMPSSFALADGTLNLLNGSLTNTGQLTPPVKNVTIGGDSITVRYVFANARVEKDKLHPKCYNWTIQGMQNNATVGESAYPFLIDSFEVPEGMKPVLKINTDHQAYKFVNYPLVPAKPMRRESANDTYTLSDVPAYKGSPSAVEPVKILGFEYYRGHKIVRVEVSPVNTPVYSGMTQAYSIISYTISFVPRELDEEAPQIKSISDKMLGLFVSGNINYSQAVSTPANMIFFPAPYYLIITNDKLLAAANNFADWKKKMGFNVKVASNSKWTATTVKNTIKSVYDDENLDYVLLLGDSNMVPTNSVFIDGESIKSDYPYSCLDLSSDDVPDVYMGRIPVATLQEANTVLNKIITYEKTPPTANDFYKSALICSDFDTNTTGIESTKQYVECCEKINQGLLGEGLSINRVYSSKKTNVKKYWHDGTLLPDSLQYPNFGWDGDKFDITSHLNDGCFIAMHRDHGSSNGWVSPSYTTSDLVDLTNDKKLPVVFSINCSSGNFISSKCFASNMLKMEGGGCVGAIACTAGSYTDINNVFAPGLFEAIWPDGDFPDNYINDDASPALALGQILHAGYATIDKFTNSFSTNTEQLYQKYIYHCFGDPSMRIYTKKPTAVVYSNNRIIIPKVLATITNCNSFSGKVMIAKVEGPAAITIPSDAGLDLDLCVSGPNLRPLILSQNGVTPLQAETDNMDGVCIDNLMECEISGNTLNVYYEVDNKAILEVANINFSNIRVRQDINNAGKGFFEFNNLSKGFYVVSLTTETGEKINKKIIIK